MSNKEDVDKIDQYYEDKILEDLFKANSKPIKLRDIAKTSKQFEQLEYQMKWATVPSNWMPTSKGIGADFHWSSEPAQPVRAIDQRKEIEQDVQTVDFE